MKRLTQLSLTFVILLLSAALASAAPQFVGDVSSGLNDRLGWEFVFRTNGPGMSRVEWGKDESLGNATPEYVSLDTTHRHVLFGLEPNTTYFYRIVLSDWSGNVTEGEINSFTTPPLEAPSGVGAYGVKERVLLGWNGVFGAAEYRVYRSEQPAGPFVEVGSTTDTNFVDEGLVDGKEYFYIVSAVSASGEELKSEVVDATPHPLTGHVIAAWLMTECNGDTIRDFSMHGNHGQFVKPAWEIGRAHV